MVKQASSWWLLDSHDTTRRTPWLQSTLAELELKTEAMLNLIEHDADSFAQRAEMYYKKRPELISMVEDFYRTHRLLAAKYDQLKSESGSRLISTLGSPFSATKQQPVKLTTKADQNYETCSETSDLEDSFSATKHQPVKLTSKTDQNYETCSETSDLEDFALSEVDNPEEEEEEEIQLENERKRGEEETQEADMMEEMRKLREEVERLKEEKRAQTEQLAQKDEEKKEVIRQLSFTVDLLKEENVRLRKGCLRMEREQPPKRRNNNPFELSQLKSTFLGKLFNMSPAFIAL